jgi:hypothetical protein
MSSPKPFRSTHYRAEAPGRRGLEILEREWLNGI